MKNMAKGARLTSNRALTKRFGFKIFNKTLIPRLIIFVAIVAISGAATGCSLIPSSLSLPSETQAVLSGSGITFSNGYGITVLSQTVKGREIDLEVTTTAVQGTHEIIILLPESYYSNPTARYPVLYLLNGALAGPSQWVTSGGMAGAITDPYNLITVIPDGGLKGWYVNWNNCATICPQNWQTFHLDQLVPWIDANLRTIPDRSARAIAGLSMGGYGAVHYAEVAPNLFSYVASFSGALDTGNFTTEVTINAEEAGLVPGSGTPVPPGSIFGNNYIADSDVNPANIANLKNTFVALYVGQGDATGPGIVEAAVYQQNQLMAYNMAQAGIHYWYSEDHEPSQAFGWGCDGDHDINCWNAYLANALPTMMTHLTPATNVSPPLPPPDTNVVVNPGFESGMAPWTCSGSCGVDIGLGNAHSGNNNGWVRNSFGWNDIEQSVSVVPDTTYTLTGWIRTSSNNTAGYFGVRDLGGNILGETRYNSLPNYTQLTLNLNTGYNTTVVVFAGLWAVNGDTWAQVDDISLTPDIGVIPPPVVNLVVNPGFESGMAPWTCSGSCSVDIGKGNAHSGNNNGWVRNSFGWNDIEQTVSVVPDTTYTLTGWIRTSSNNTAGYFGLRDLQGNVIGQTQYGSLPNYTQLSVTINVGPVNKVVLFAGLWAVNGDTWAQVDDVSLSPN